MDTRTVSSPVSPKAPNRSSRTKSRPGIAMSDTSHTPVMPCSFR